jgi:cytidylate kinase
VQLDEILGRGAHLILGPHEALRTLVVAPWEARVATGVADQEGISRHEAASRIEAQEAERRAFLMKYLHADVGDPAAYDLVVNTHVLGVEGAVETIKSALPTVAARARAYREERATA